MGNYAQQPQMNQAPQMNEYLAALFNAFQPQMQGAAPMQQAWGGQSNGPAEIQNGQFDPMADYNRRVAAMNWNPNDQQMGAYQQELANMQANSPHIKNAEQVAAAIALFGQGYGGMPDWNDPKGMQIHALMQRMKQPQMPPTTGYPVTPPAAGGGAGLQLPPGGGYPITPPTMPGPNQAGIAQMNPVKTMNTMPNPMDKILGGTAGQNPWVPKRNKWGAL